LDASAAFIPLTAAISSTLARLIALT